jgi:hypothetical protein
VPLISRLDFVARGGLSVAYRASPTPQELSIDVLTTGIPMKGNANWQIQALIDTINAGGAGGSIFPPSQGFAEMLSGPRSDRDALRPDHHIVLRVASVAPLFLRSIIEDMRGVGIHHPVTEFRIVGSLPLDPGPLSVRETHVRAWLDDPNAYLDRWPTPGFPLSFTDLREGAALRVVLEGPINPSLREALEYLSVRWLNAIRNNVSYDGREVTLNPGKLFPAFGQGKTEFRASYQEVPFARESSRAVLSNMLTRFHEKVAPIAEAEISL